MALLVAGLVAGSAGEMFPPNIDARPRRDPSNGDLSLRDRLELDLYHAEDALRAARTPGGARKARRRVEAIRAELEAYAEEAPHAA